MPFQERNPSEDPNENEIALQKVALAQLTRRAPLGVASALQLVPFHERITPFWPKTLHMLVVGQLTLKSHSVVAE